VKKSILIVFLLSLVVSCTDNTLTKAFGGTKIQPIPCGTRLEMVTWKNADVWYLLRRLEPGEVPRKYVFKESSNFGVMEGEIRLEETRCK
jgi:hypothetical protein